MTTTCKSMSCDGLLTGLGCVPCLHHTKRRSWMNGFPIFLPSPLFLFHNLSLSALCFARGVIMANKTLHKVSASQCCDHGVDSRSKDRVLADQIVSEEKHMLLVKRPLKPCPEHESQQRKPHDISQTWPHQCLLYTNRPTRGGVKKKKEKRTAHFRLGIKCGWMWRIRGRVRIATLWKSSKSSLGCETSDGGSVLHLTGRPQTLKALCDGMLLLEAATTKIKRGILFTSPHRPDISTLSWQPSKESRGVWLRRFKVTSGLFYTNLF